MLRRFGAAVAVLACLFGFSAAPYTHAHHAIGSLSDERHPHGDTLVHTHASPHSRDDAHDHDRHAPGTEDSEDQIWSVSTFVFQQPASIQAPSVVLVMYVDLKAPPASIRLGVDATRPTAHGPPAGSPSGLRAPPAIPPALA